MADALEGCGVPHVVGGSLASSVSDEPRSTLDIDLVVAMTQADVEPFLTALGRACDADDHALRYGLARARARPVDTLSRTPDLAGGDREGIAVVRAPPYPPSGSANTNSVLPRLGRSSGVRALKCADVPTVPVPTAMYCRPSTA